MTPATVRFRGSLEAKGEFYLNDKWTLGMGHHRDVRPVLSQRLQDQERRPVAVLSCRTSSRRSICAARRIAASSISAAISSRARPPPPTSGRSRSPPGPRLQQDDSRSRPTRPADIGGEIKVDLNAANIARDGGGVPVVGGATRSTRPINLYNVCGTGGTVVGGYRSGGTTRRRAPIRRPTIVCCAASPATTRACPSRSPGSASSSIRSARPGRRSCSRASTAR